jgi:hypothetical protein
VFLFMAFFKENGMAKKAKKKGAKKKKKAKRK